MAVAVLLVVGAVVAVFPPVGQFFVCTLSNAFESISGGHPSGCKDPGRSQAGGDKRLPPRLSVSVPADPTATTGTVGVKVDVNDGVTYTVTSDQSWAVPYGDGWGTGSGTASVLFQANAGQERQATLTITSSDGKTQKVTVAQPGATQTYVAWGDSYSAGVGTDPTTWPTGADYDYSERRSRWGPDAWNEDNCYRSIDGWPRQLGDGRQSAAAGTPNLSMDTGGFKACSGGTWDGTSLTGNSGSPSIKDQMLSTDPSAGVVTLSLGGNDIGFADIVTNCVNPASGGVSWNPSTTADNYVAACASGIADGRRTVAQDLGPRLKQAYEQALASAPNATIYVVGYPPVVEADDVNHTWVPGQIPPANIPEAVQLLTDLNDKIRETVDEANAESGSGPRLVYVDPMAPDSPFNGHSVGDADPYTNSIRLHSEAGLNSIPSYHPNREGNDAYARLVAQYIMGDYGG